ncbi:MAG: aminotransferase class IV [Bacteroidota bacterium]
MPYYAFLNGKMLPSEKAFVHISDLGLLRGYAVFDYLRTYNRKPFLLQQHLARFEHSARELNLELPCSGKQIEGIISRLLSKSAIRTDCGIRLLLTGGRSADGITISRPTFAITTEKLIFPPESAYRKGVKLITREFQRESPYIKTTNYKNAIRLNPEKLRQKAHEILYCSGGKILETTRNNFFVFKGDTLITPGANILHGITRSFVLSFAKGVFRVEERDVLVSELPGVSEAFITGTTRKILPVVKVNDQAIGEGKPGKNSLHLLKLFEEKLAER